MSDLVPFLNETSKDESLIATKKKFDSFTKKLNYSREIKLMCGDDVIVCRMNLEEAKQENKSPHDIDECISFTLEQSATLKIHPTNINDFRILVGGVQVGGTMQLQYDTDRTRTTRNLDKDGYSDVYLCDRDRIVFLCIKVGPFLKREEFDSLILGDTSWANNRLQNTVDAADGENQEAENVSNVENFQLICSGFELRAPHLLERLDVLSAKSKLLVSKGAATSVFQTTLIETTKCPQDVLLAAAASIRDMVKADLNYEVETLMASLTASRTVTVSIASSDSALEETLGQAQFVFEKSHVKNKNASFFEVAFPNFPTLSFTSLPNILCKISMGGMDIMKTKFIGARNVNLLSPAWHVGEDGWIRHIKTDGRHKEFSLKMKFRPIIDDVPDGDDTLLSSQRFKKGDKIEFTEKTVLYEMFLRKLGLMAPLGNRANFELVLEGIEFPTKRFLDLFQFMDTEDDDEVEAKAAPPCSKTSIQGNNTVLTAPVADNSDDEHEDEDDTEWDSELDDYDSVGDEDDSSVETLEEIDDEEDDTDAVEETSSSTQPSDLAPDSSGPQPIGPDTSRPTDGGASDAIAEEGRSAAEERCRTTHPIVPHLTGDDDDKNMTTEDKSKSYVHTFLSTLSNTMISSFSTKKIVRVSLIFAIAACLGQPTAPYIQ